MKVRSFILSAALAFSCLSIPPVQSSPWAEVGDSQLRSDIDLLAAAGVLDGPTTHWPLPWRSIIARLRSAPLTYQPAAVQAAAARLLRQGQAQIAPGTSASLYLDATSKPAVIRGFDGMGRGQGQTQLSLSGASGAFSGRLSVGVISQNFGGRGNKLMLDGTYVAASVSGARVYAGYLDHWWGPGQISALTLSNNARPMPQVGIERASTAASSLPLFNWLGPWQVEFLLGYMDGPRIQSDTYYNALRFTFNPLPGLEIGGSRTEMFCGQGHSCVPLRDYFNFRNDLSSMNNTNDEGEFDIKYANRIAGFPFQVYMQVMNEDSSPIINSGSSHLFGFSLFVPAPANPVKLTMEYADSIATHNIFSFGDNRYGFSYTNTGSYFDGMRYRGRTLGFSLDDDSTLLSLQGSWTDAGGRFYQLSLHHATIGSSHSGGVNVVSATPVLLNMGEARISLPLSGDDKRFHLDLAARLQDDQPRPSKGFAAAIEAAIRIGL